MPLADSQIVDLVTTTQKELGRMRWTDLSTDTQSFEVLPRMLKKDKVRFETGEGIQRNFMKTTSGAAKHVGLYNVDDVNVGDVMGTLDIPWRHSTTNYSFDRREKGINSGPEQIVDLIKIRRADAMISLAQLCESTFWNKPVDSNDKVTPFGLFYWIVRNATEGFNGGNPSGFSSGAGNVDSTTVTRWRNYTFQYVDVSKQDLIKKMRTAYRKTMFKSPVSVPDYRTGAGDRWRLYMNEATLSSMEDVGEAQDENLGRDLAPMDGTMAFRRNPMIYVPALDSDTTNPIFGVDWGVFFIYFLRGSYMREDPPEKAPNQHNVFTIHVDMSWNTLCTDRRALFVGYK